MTVLAHFEDLGIAVSDILLSVEEPGGGIRLPSIGDPRVAHAGLPMRPTRLVRKFIKVQRPRSAGVFLVCGTVNHVEKVVQNVNGLISGVLRPPPALAHKFFPSKASSLIDVAAHMAEADGSHDFELLGAVDGVGYRRHFQTSVAQKLPYWGKVTVMGSGGPDLLEWLIAKGLALEAAGLLGDDRERRQIRAQNAVPSLLLEEDTRSTMHTLKKGVGGYYESFEVHDTDLLPFDRILTIFGRFKPQNGRLDFELRRVFFHTYDGDDLIIGNLTGLPMTISSPEPLRLPLSDLEVFSVPPLGQEPNSGWSGSRLALKMGAPLTMRLTTYRGARDQSVQRFYEGQGGRRLIQAKAGGESMQLQLDQSELEYFLSRSDQSVPLS